MRRRKVKPFLEIVGLTAKKEGAIVVKAALICLLVTAVIQGSLIEVLVPTIYAAIALFWILVFKALITNRR